MKWGDKLKAQKVLKTPEIIAAFNRVDRADFLPDEYKSQASDANPIPIGFGQTNSAPLVVGQMFEWLQPKSGQNILDVGAGSGWTTALLAEIVGSKGRITAVERIAELVDFASENLKNYNYKNVEIHQAEHGILGWPGETKYDRILVSATAKRDMTDELLKQLKNNGALVIPLVETGKLGFVDHCIHVFTKTSDDCLDELHPGYVFVPIIPHSPDDSRIYGL